MGETPAVDHATRLKRALVALERMQARLDEVERARVEPIAICGIGCRMPGGVHDRAGAWRLLSGGVDAIREVPRDRWDVDALYDPDPEAPGKMYTRYGGFLDRVDGFDARFFGISPREALAMDPQQRLLLEVAWEALEDAGQPPDRLFGTRAGVFVGFFSFDYYNLQVKAGDAGINAYTGTGNTASVAAGRISYVLGLQGPSMALDTACSSSLVAVHLACQSLRARECDLALAGGVNLILTPDRTIYFCKLKAMAKDGRCKAFDAAADGYVRGEGAGMVVLKRLSDALRDRDPILAVVLGSATNQDGRSNGLTAPNGPAQEAVIRQALEAAGVAPGEVGYVEAHGSGTPLGDPIEARALGSMLGRGRPAEAPLPIGSIKSNFGHLEAAAGIAGLIKATLSLHHGAIPAHLHLKNPSPHIPWQELGIDVPTRLTPWPAGSGRRVAGINSFGFSGTNAHLVLGEAPALPVRADSSESLNNRAEDHFLLPLSARSIEALRILAAAWVELLGGPDAPGCALALRDLCYTASVRRTHHEHRLAVTGSSADALKEGLEAWLRGESHPGVHAGSALPGQRPKVVFVFPGQGSQWFGMARELLETEPAFRNALQQCAGAIGRFVDWSPLELLTADEETARLHEIDRLQPTLFAIEVALAALWRSRGIEPDVVVGHSMGEVAAAVVAGALSLEDGARVICRRSRLLRRVRGQGAMAVVELSLEQCREALAGLEDRLSVAVNNGPRSTVVSGDAAALNGLLETLAARGIFCRPVKVDVASHSPQMDPLRADLLDALEGITPREALIPMHSTVTGGVLTGLELDARYWVNNLREPVLFWPAIDRLSGDGHDVYLELSPHPILLPAIREGLLSAGREGLVLPSMRRGEGERKVMLDALAEMHVRGGVVDWTSLFPGDCRCVRLPTYPWQRERFWITDGLPGVGGNGQLEPSHPTFPDDQPHHQLLGRRVPSPLEPMQFQSWVGAKRPGWLADHRLHEVVVVPGATWLAMSLAAAREADLNGRALEGVGAGDRGSAAGAGLMLEDVFFPQALVLPEEEGAREVQLVLEPAGDGTARVRTFSRSTAQPGEERSSRAWQPHFEARILPRPARATGVVGGDGHTLEAIRNRCTDQLSSEAFYSRMAARGYQFGSTFRTVGQVWRRDGEALCRLRLPDGDAEVRQVALLDCCLQFPSAAFPVHYFDTTYVPIGLERLLLDLPEESVDAGRDDAGLEQELWCHVRVRDGAADPEQVVVDVRILDRAGNQMVSLEGLQARRAPAEALRARAGGSSVDGLFYALEWEVRPIAAPPRIQVGRWLIFTDRAGLGGTLAEQLEAHGGEVIPVFRAKRGAGGGLASDVDPAGRELYVDPDRPEDFRRVLHAAVAGKGPLQGVLYLWGLDIDPIETSPSAGRIQGLHGGLADKPNGFDVLEAAERLGCVGPLHLVQALVRAGIDTRLWLVARQSQTDPAQALLWGLGGTIASEHPELRCSRLEIDGTGGAGLAQAVLEELLADGIEDQVAFREGQRFVARLASARQNARSTDRDAAGHLKPDGTWLVTGGLGGIGLELASWLVDRGVRSLVLAGRSEPTDEARVLLDSLRETGASIKTARVDVSSPLELSWLLEEIREGMPPLVGVVHGAARLDDGVLLQQRPDRFRNVFAPKVDGAWNLHCLTRDLPLEHFVLFSSTAALLGAPGQGNYAAASAFLDALAHHRRAIGLPAFSIDWGPWTEVGLAAMTEGRGERLAGRGMAGIRPDVGLEAFGRLLSSDAARCAVMHFDLAQWRRFYPRAAGHPLFTRLEAAIPERTPVRVAASLRDRLMAEEAGPKRVAVLEALLRQEIAKVLRMAPAHLDPRKPFGSFGLDSLMALEIRNNLEAGLGLSLSATLVWAYPTLAQLVPHLAGRLGIGLEPESPPDPPARAATPIEVPDEASLEALSEDEMAAMLARELEELGRRKGR